MLVESESQGCQQGLEGKIEALRPAGKEDRLPGQGGRPGRAWKGPMAGGSGGKRGLGGSGGQGVREPGRWGGGQ